MSENVWISSFMVSSQGFPTKVLRFPTKVLGFPTKVLGFPTKVKGFPTKVVAEMAPQTCFQSVHGRIGIGLHRFRSFVCVRLFPAIST